MTWYGVLKITRKSGNIRCRLLGGPNQGLLFASSNIRISVSKISFYNLCFMLGGFVDLRPNIKYFCCFADLRNKSMMVFGWLWTKLVIGLRVNMILSQRYQALTRLSLQTLDNHLEKNLELGPRFVKIWLAFIYFVFILFVSQQLKVRPIM